MPASHHGTVLSILFARASSIAQALPGVANRVEAGFDGLPGWVDAPAAPAVGRREGERIGEEKERR